MRKLDRLAINEEGFIFDPDNGNSFTVNQTGLFIIKALKNNKSEEEILQLLKEEFEVDEEEAKRDLIDFIDQLKLYGLLEKKDV